MSFTSYSAHSSVAGQRRSANVEQSGGLFSSLMGETSVTQRWIRGEISNFQYLMALNTLAGRTYRLKISIYIFPTLAVIICKNPMFTNSEVIVYGLRGQVIEKLSIFTGFINGILTL